MAAKMDLSDLGHHLALLGVWLVEEDHRGTSWKLFHTLRRYLFFSLVLVWLCSGHLIGWRVFLGRTYSGVVIGCSNISVQWAIVSFSGDHIHEFVETVKGILLRNPESGLFHRLMDPSWRFARFFTAYGIFTVIAAYALPIAYDLFVTVTGLGEPLGVHPGVEGVLPQNKNVVYWLILFYQVVGNLLGVMFLVGNLSLLVLSINYTRVAIQILSKKVRSWADSPQELLLNEIISDHATLIKLSKLLNNFLALQSFVQNVLSTLTITIILYAIRQQAGSQLAVCVNNLNGITVIVFVYCHLGEQLHTESTELYHQICFVPWYSKSIRSRESLVAILRQAQRPLQIRYKGWTLRMEAFTQMINTTYSYFMLLTSTE